MTWISNPHFAWLFRNEFNKDSYFHDTAKIYEGAKFRDNMTLIMEEDTFIGTNATILVPKLIMRKGSQINAGAILAGRKPITLKENVVVSYGCILITASDSPEAKFMNDASSETERKIIQGPIIIKKNAFIGAHTIIGPKVVVEEGIVVRAKSYVGKNLTQKYFIYDDNKPLKPRVDIKRE